MQLECFQFLLLMMPINTTGINSLKNEEISHGTAIMNFGRNGWLIRNSINGYFDEFWRKNILIYIAIAFNCN